MKLKRCIQPSFGMLFLAPAVNVTLLLVFFVLLSSAMLLQPGISIRVPASPFLVEPQKNPLVVSITGEPLPAIYLENKKVRATELGDELSKKRDAGHTIIVKADQRAPVDLLVKVITEATQRGMPVVLGTTEAP